MALARGLEYNIFINGTHVDDTALIGQAAG